MAHKSEPELTANVVAKRFADSADALAELHDQLLTLATAEENATTAASDINQIVVAAREFVVAAAALVDETKTAQVLASKALAAATVFLKNAKVDSTKEVVEDFAIGINARLTKIESSLVGFETRLGKDRLRDARIAELEAELARRTARLPRRVKRQLGVEE